MSGLSVFSGCVCVGLVNFSSSLLSLSLVWLTVGVSIFSQLSSSKVSWLWLWLFLVLVASFLVKSLLSFYVLFELSLIPILLMIIFWGNQPERLSAGLYFLIYTSIMSIPFLILLVSVLGISSFNLVKTMSLSWFFGLFLIIPFLVKMPVFGLHFWLPKAHVEASTSGSMILAGVLLKLGSYGIYRVSGLFFFKNMKFLLFFWLLSTGFSGLLTFMQSDMKKTVAYSSVTHMTFLLVGLLSELKTVFISALMLSLAHGWASVGMFASVGIFGSSSNSRMGFLMGADNKFHWTVVLLGLLLVSNSSLPPFPSFFPELMMLVGLSFSSPWVLLFVIVSLVVCYYNAYLFMWVAHWNSLESKEGALSYSEGMKLFGLSLLIFNSLFWLIST